MPSETIHGESLDDGGVRLEGDGDGEWIEADYRDGWVGRKLVNPRDPDAYDEMVEPYVYKCAWFEATEDGTLPMPTKCCPKCKGTNIEIGVIADYDAVCQDCDHAWDDRAIPQEGDSA